MIDYNNSYRSYINSYRTYTTDSANTGHIYYGSDPGWGSPYYPPWQELSLVTVITKIVEAPAPEPQNNRKEKTKMHAKQNFLDALTDEGKTITSEERSIIRDAPPDKLELLFARLLARAFVPSDLEMLKEKPKEVLIKEA